MAFDFLHHGDWTPSNYACRLSAIPDRVGIRIARHVESRLDILDAFENTLLPI